MISAKIQEMLNKQINLEMYSGYIYMGMANYYEQEGLSGFASWFEVQASEEWGHAMRIRRFCFDNEIPVKLEAIACPAQSYDDFMAPLTAALAHEKVVTASIHKIAEAALEEKDFRTKLLMDWFVDEQQEEEVTAAENIRNYELFATCGNGLRHMNSKMGSRKAD